MGFNKIHKGNLTKSEKQYRNKMRNLTQKIIKRKPNRNSRAEEFNKLNEKGNRDHLQAEYTTWKIKSAS